MALSVNGSLQPKSGSEANQQSLDQKDLIR